VIDGWCKFGMEMNGDTDEEAKIFKEPGRGPCLSRWSYNGALARGIT
jgi:hypothetical protein